jgi:hypothetical protein
MRCARRIGLAVGLAVYAVACGNIIGIPDRYYEAGDDASSDGSTGPEGAGGDHGGTGDGPLAGDQAAGDHAAGDGPASSSSSSGGGDGSIGDAPVLAFDACPYCDDSGLCVLACNQNHPNSIALDTTNVYWSNKGDPANGYDGSAILQVGKTGIGLMELALPPAEPAGITIGSNGCVYWIEYAGGNTIRGMCPAAPPATVLSNSGADYFAILGTTLVWATSGGGSESINQCSLSACSSTNTEITNNRTSPFALAVDSQQGVVYWLEQSNGNGTVLSCPIFGGCTTPSLVGVMPGPAQSLAVVPGAVVWTSGTPGQNDGEVAYLLGVTGQIMLQATHRSVPTGVATDGQSVYWVEQGAGSTGVVIGCDLDASGDCSSTIRAYAGGLALPIAVAVDAKRIYWVNQGLPGFPGSVMSALR